MMMKKVVSTTTTMMMSLYGRITLVQMLFTKIGFYKELLVRKISDIYYNVNKSSLTTRISTLLQKCIEFQSYWIFFHRQLPMVAGR